jgi:hypothetical protein
MKGSSMLVKSIAQTKNSLIGLTIRQEGTLSQVFLLDYFVSLKERGRN